MGRFAQLVVMVPLFHTFIYTEYICVIFVRFLADSHPCLYNSLLVNVNVCLLTFSDGYF